VAFNNYDIDWQRLVRWNTPARLIQATILSWLYSITYPIVVLHVGFKKFRTAKLYDIAMNYQVCYLEGFLNDRFDFTQRRIYIEDAASQYPQTYIYRRSENKPVKIFRRSENRPYYIRRRAEYTGNVNFDFIINVPISVVYDESEMRAMVATKLAGKKYSIQTF
jgi:hypothetical protein